MLLAIAAARCALPQADAIRASALGPNETVARVPQPAHRGCEDWCYNRRYDHACPATAHPLVGPPGARRLATCTDYDQSWPERCSWSSCAACRECPRTYLLKTTKDNPGAARKARLVYNSGGRSFAVCACNKCGTTSLFEWMYESIFGRPFVRRLEPPYVQDVEEWGAAPNGTIDVRYDSSHTEVVAIVREPLDRYASAFRSKIRCHRVGFSMNRQLRRRTDVDDGNRMVPALLQLAGLDPSLGHVADSTMKETHCLDFADYALALHTCGQE